VAQAMRVMIVHGADPMLRVQSMPYSMVVRD